MQAEPAIPRENAVHLIRAATAADHEAVDSVFGGHDLGDRAAYTAFLRAHARALPAVEAALTGRSGLPAWRERRSALAADLADLGEPMPAPLPVAPPVDDAAAWGMLYVIEGSRLGGAMLARAVPGELPSRYLAARHERGEWRALLAALDAAAGDAAWLDSAVAAARATFALYGRAATAD